MPPVDIRTIANEAAEAGWAWVLSTSSTRRMLRDSSGPSGRPLSWIRVLMDDQGVDGLRVHGLVWRSGAGARTPLARPDRLELRSSISSFPAFIRWEWGDR